MKTLKNMMIVLLLLMANVTIAQAINYPTYENKTQVMYVTPNTLAPGYQTGDEVFHTSDLTPLVDGNGYAVEPYSAAPGRPRRAEEGDDDDDNIPTLGDQVPPPLPIGSILILLLFALMHVGYIAYSTSVRKQK